MELYIIRHAQSTNNVLTDQRDRVCDPHLTELGQRQAKILAQHLNNGTELQPPDGMPSDHHKGYGITHLYCSAMWRALQTAQPIGQALGLQPEVWIDLHEKGGIFLDHAEAGITGYPGMTRQEILAEFPDYVLPEGITEQGWWNRGHEDWPTCHGRAIKVADELRKRVSDTGKVAIVSHGGFVDALLKALFNQLPGRHLFYFHYNTAISRIDFCSDSRLDFRYLNSVAHMPVDLIS